MKRVIGVWGILVLLCSVGLDAGVSITLKSYQKARKGDKIVWVRAKKVIPGTTVRYINTIKNNEPEMIENLVLRNVVPAHMRYIGGSQKCTTACETYFSVDHGKHFSLPEKLQVKDQKSGKMRRARPSEYTAIKWVIKSLAPGKKIRVGYKAKLL